MTAISEPRMCPVLHPSSRPSLSRSWQPLLTFHSITFMFVSRHFTTFHACNNGFVVRLGWTLHLPSLWGSLASQARCRWEIPGTALHPCMSHFTSISLSRPKYLQCVPCKFHYTFPKVQGAGTATVPPAPSTSREGKCTVEGCSRVLHRVCTNKMCKRCCNNYRRFRAEKSRDPVAVTSNRRCLPPC